MSSPRRGALQTSSANELRLPAGEPVELLLHANDVIHSFWVPNLAGKTDLIPGRVNRMVIQGDRPGIYRGQCAEYWVGSAFSDGVRRHCHARGRNSIPGSPHCLTLRPSLRLQSCEGRRLFITLGCGHVPRASRLERRTARAGSHADRRAPQHRGGRAPGRHRQLAAWIASAQHLKPGNLMPSMPGL